MSFFFTNKSSKKEMFDTITTFYLAVIITACLWNLLHRYYNNRHVASLQHNIVFLCAMCNTENLFRYFTLFLTGAFNKPSLNNWLSVCCLTFADFGRNHKGFYTTWSQCVVYLPIYTYTMRYVPLSDINIHYFVMMN